ncbi:MAG TPA: oligosaccharide flippase family protein [Candidatus Acidoferrum sp.]|nr:oligosaccharide flippase family protein [Candidatus Acidoferrum sp.]
MTSTALPPIPGAAPEAAVQVVGSPAQRIRITAERLRVWGIRSALSVLDQGLTAAVGFGVNVVLARWLSPTAYGAFAVAFATFLLISGFYNVLLLEPLTVMGPSRHSHRLPAYFREQVVLHVLLVGVLAALILVAGAVFWWLSPDNPLAGALLGSGLALPFMTLLWLIRRMCYVLQQPSFALLGSGFYVSFVFCGFLLLRHFQHIDPLTAFGLMGIGSLLSALVLWLKLDLKQTQTPREPQRMLWREAARENWSYGRWLVGSTALSSISNQVQMFLVASTVGLGAAGVLRAMQIPGLVMTHVNSATGLLILPAFSYDFGNGSIARLRHKASLVSLALGGGTLAFAAALALTASRTEHLLYGGKYAEYAWLMPVLALVPTALGGSIGYSMALRAMHRPHFDLVANSIAAPVGVISAIVLMRWWGLGGAAASIVLSYATYAVMTCWIYRAAAQRSRKELCKT